MARLFTLSKGDYVFVISKGGWGGNATDRHIWNNSKNTTSVVFPYLPSLERLSVALSLKNCYFCVTTAFFRSHGYTLNVWSASAFSVRSAFFRFHSISFICVVCKHHFYVTSFFFLAHGTSMQVLRYHWNVWWQSFCYYFQTDLRERLLCWNENTFHSLCTKRVHERN